MSTAEPTLMDLCVCGQHFYCPDGYHQGSGCGCTPDCCLDPTLHDYQGEGDEPCAVCDDLPAAHEVQPEPEPPMDPTGVDCPERWDGIDA